MTAAPRPSCLVGLALKTRFDKEREQFPDLVTYTIGMHGVVIVANEDNKIRGLSTQQIQDIYTRKSTNWRELGGRDRRILLITLNHNQGTPEFS